MQDFRDWGRRLVDWVADYLENPQAHRVLSAIRPNDIVNALPARAPHEGEPMERIFSDFERIILPGITHWNHPNFFAYFAITSSPPAILAELLAGALNANGILWRTSPALTELEVVTLRWLLGCLGLPESWFGQILDTGSTSTLHALAAARVHACPEVRDEGAPRNLTVYCSEQAHSSVEKAAMALGFGRRQMRRIPTDPEFRMRPDALAEAITADRVAGFLPCCVVATVGTTSTTSIDPVSAIADVAERQNVWLHVDAAYAGSAAIAPELRWILDGCDRADSFFFNPHKWMMVPVDCSAFYSRRPAVLRRAFSLSAEYLETSGSGLDLMHYGIPLGRRFRALKLWFVLRYYGSEGLAAIIRRQVAMARQLRDRIAANAKFEICAPAPLSTVCFRIKGSDELNRRLLDAVNRQGRFFLSHTVLNGRFVLRIAIGNINTKSDDVSSLWVDVENLSDALST